MQHKFFLVTPSFFLSSGPVHQACEPCILTRDPILVLKPEPSVYQAHETCILTREPPLATAVLIIMGILVCAYSHQPTHVHSTTTPQPVLKNGLGSSLRPWTESLLLILPSSPRARGGGSNEVDPDKAPACTAAGEHHLLL